MAKPIDRQEPLVQDTLARIDALGESDRKVEREAGIPQGFLKKSRQGKNRHETAAPSWAKLRVWLANRGAVGRGIDFEPPTIPKAVAALAGLEPPVEGGQPSKASLARTISEIGTSAKRHREACQSLAIAIILGIFSDDLKAAEIALSTLKAMKDAIKLEKFESAQEKIGDLEIMTEDELEDFRAWQASRMPRGLAPGEAPKPPEKRP